MPYSESLVPWHIKAPSNFVMNEIVMHVPQATEHLLVATTIIRYNVAIQTTSIPDYLWIYFQFKLKLICAQLYFAKLMYDRMIMLIIYDRVNTVVIGLYVHDRSKIVHQTVDSIINKQQLPVRR